MALASYTCLAQKFGYIYMDEVTMLCPEADEARVKMQAASKEAQETYTEMVNEYNKKAETYQQKAATWTAATLESKQKELTEMQQRIQEYSNNIQQELQQQEQALFAPIMEKAQKAIEEVGKKHELAGVFPKFGLLYRDDAQLVDITPEVRVLMGVPADRTLEQLQKEMQAAAAAQ